MILAAPFPYDSLAFPFQRSIIPVHKLRRAVSVPYTVMSDYVVGSHGSLVRAAAELLPVEARGRVCVHVSSAFLVPIAKMTAFPF